MNTAASRMLVMKKSAGTPSYPPSDSTRSAPLIQKVGPDFSKLSRDLNRVVLKIQHQSEVSSDCPMHASHDQPQARRGSRGSEGDHRRGSRSQEVTHRSSSAEIKYGHLAVTGRLSNPEQSYQSLPRRLSSLSSQAKSSKVDRRQSFQDFKTFRDKFTGPLDFKSTLRTAGSGGGERDRGRRGRQYSEPRGDSQNIEERRGGYWIESDFDFRSPPGTRDNSRERARDYYAQDVTNAPRRGQANTGATMARAADNKKYQYGYLDLKNIIQSPTELKSPGIKIPPHNNELISPVSPRRVEFADEVFPFTPPATSRPASRCESPNPKGILRHTMSDPQRGATRSNTVELGNVEMSNTSRSIRNNGAVRSNTTDLSLPLSRPTSLIIPTSESPTVGGNSQPLVKILLPDEQNDSDDTLIEEKHETEPSKERDQKPKRALPPLLADWNRTQSFPPASRPTSDQPELPTDLDLIRGHNESLRVRVGDLEQQVHDNNDEIKCLRATLAECLRKVGDIETKIKQSDQLRPKRRDLSEGSKSKRNPYAASSNFGSQDFTGRATFEMYAPPQRGTYAPRQR